MKKGMFFVLMSLFMAAVLSMSGCKSKQTSVQTYPAVTVDYDMTLNDMSQAGNYDLFNNDIITAKHFPVTGKGRAEVALRLIQFNRDISTETALAELDKLGLRPATLPELLAFGAAYPEQLQRQFPIIALGSTWVLKDGNRGVAYLFEFGSERRLYLCWCGRVWGEDCLFLAVSK